MSVFASVDDEEMVESGHVYAKAVLEITSRSRIVGGDFLTISYAAALLDEIAERLRLAKKLPEKRKPHPSGWLTAVRPYPSHAVLYIARCIDSSANNGCHLIKVGRTKNLERRARELFISPLYVRYVEPHNMVGEEAALLRRFPFDRAGEGRERFRCNLDELDAWIQVD